MCARQPLLPAGINRIMAPLCSLDENEPDSVQPLALHRNVCTRSLQWFSSPRKPDFLPPQTASRAFLSRGVLSVRPSFSVSLAHIALPPDPRLPPGSATGSQRGLSLSPQASSRRWLRWRSSRGPVPPRVRPCCKGESRDLDSSPRGKG